MTSKISAKTWWGEQWLNSLQAGQSRPFTRGNAYVEKGPVRSIIFQENIIKAKVKGAKPRPYEVALVVPAFSPDQIKELVNAIAVKPVIVSKLLNHQLDPEVLAIAKQQGLRIFPVNWTDFNISCSCREWTRPCKHQIAVMYRIGTEIDKNPFLVFSIHKVNFWGELEKQNIFVGGNTTIPNLSVLLKNGSTEIKAEIKKPVATEEVASATGETALTALPAMKRGLNYASLSPIHESLIQLLADAPVFYQGSGNFREKYATILRKIVKNAQRLIAGKSTIYEFFGQIQLVTDARRKDYGKPAFTLGHHSVIQLTIETSNETGIWVGERREYFPLSQLILALWQIPAAHIQDYQPSVEALKSSLLLAMNLIANGAIVPQIVQLDNKNFAVRRLPALLSKEVNTLVENLQETLPPNILVVAGYPPVQLKERLAVTLLSVWLDVIVHNMATIPKTDIFTGLFFSKNTYPFTAAGQQGLPAGIQVWLHRYFITQGRFRPVIIVKELKDEQFQIVITVKQNGKSIKKPVGLKKVLTDKKYKQQRFGVLQSLVHLSSFIPGLDEFINTNGTKLIKMDMAAFSPFLTKAIPAIQLLDIDILLPRSLKQILQPKATVRIKQKSKGSNSFMRMDRLLDFDWQVAIGDNVLDEQTFNKLLRKSEGLIKYKENYIYVNQGDLEKLHKHFTSSKQLNAFEMLRTALSDDYYGAAVELTTEVRQLIKELTDQKSIPLPLGINASLRPYQERGFAWLYKNTKIGFGSVIADDMGLGKTLQVITALLKYKEEGNLLTEKALVIAPTGLLTNWQAEIEKFAPSLKFLIYHGSGRDLEKKQDYDVLLTTYGIARSDAEKLKEMKWYAVIIDEAQNIKNHETAQSKAIKSIPSNTFIAMSGTPVENRLSELWSIMDFSNRGFLGSLPDFRENFATPIQNQNDTAAAEKLKTITAPFLMRRLKSDKTIISDLPDKIEIDCFAYLAKEQAGLYEKTLHKALEAIAAIQDTDQRTLFARQGLVLQMILALKQICNHPTQFLKNNVLEASLSGKMELLFDKLESIIESNEKVLIFTQFIEMGELLQHFITERFGEAPLFYHGGCTINQRSEMVEAFQTNRTDKIFILSLKAAGTGLNLTAANHVIHYDLWWNPAVETQATDRAYRIGQKSNVMVHRFITKGTFEERINEMIQSKKALAHLAVATGENWIGNLSNKELKDIFELA